MRRRAAAIAAAAGVAAIGWRYMAILTHSWVNRSDFTQIYMAGLAWRLGVPPYHVVQSPALAASGLDSEPFGAYFYPPLCGALGAPLTFLSYPAACMLWALLSWTVVLVALWRFALVCLPGWRVEYRLALIGATALSSGVRWPLVQLQPTLIVVGLLLLFASEVVRGRWPAAFVCGLLVSSKPTFLLPVIVLLAFLGRWRMLCALAVAIVLLNILGSLGTGAQTTWHDYRAALARVDEVNDPRALEALTPYLRVRPDSPLASDPRWEHRALTWVDPRIDVACIATAWVPYRRAATAGAVLLGAVCLGLLAPLWVRTRRQPELQSSRELQLELFAAALTGSLLLLYHQRYDAVALVPAAYVALQAIAARRGGMGQWVVALSALTFAYLLTATLVHRWLKDVVVPSGLLILVPLGGYLTLAAFAGNCAMLRRTLADARLESAASHTGHSEPGSS